MKRCVFVLPALLLLCAIAIGPASAAAAAHSAAQVGFAPRIKVTEGTSTNWSGYAVATSLTNPASGAVSDVKGQWTVPAVSCGSASSYSAVWVGIDGYSDQTVEQTGTEQDCSGGQAHYSAWYELYPKYPVTLSLAVSPGDTISAEVQYIGNNRFVLTLVDTTTGQQFSTTQKARAQRQSAEWIVEAPSSRSGVLPLANFGKVTFSGAAATLNGVTGTIADSHWQQDAITMVNSSGQPKAVPSALGSGGASFSVSWVRSN